MMLVDTENVFLNLMMMMKMMDVQDGNSFSSSMPAMYDEDEYMDNHLLDDNIMFAIEDDNPFPR